MRQTHRQHVQGGHVILADGRVRRASTPAHTGGGESGLAGAERQGGGPPTHHRRLPGGPRGTSGPVDGGSGVVDLVSDLFDEIFNLVDGTSDLVNVIFNLVCTVVDSRLAPGFPPASVS